MDIDPMWDDKELQYELRRAGNITWAQFTKLRQFHPDLQPAATVDGIRYWRPSIVTAAFRVSKQGRRRLLEEQQAEEKKRSRYKPKK